MPRPPHPKLALCVELVKSGQMSAAKAAKLHGVSRSSLSLALKRVYCPTCNHPLKRKSK